MFNTFSPPAPQKRASPYLSTSPTKLRKSNQIVASVSSNTIQIAGRGPSNLGNAQGHHVTAHALYIYIAEQICKKQFSAHAISSLANLIGFFANKTEKNGENNFDVIVESIQNIFRRLQAETKKNIDRLKEILANVSQNPETLFNNTCLSTWLTEKNEAAQQLDLDKFLSDLLKHYLTVINDFPMAAFPKHFSVEPPKDEGNRIKLALKYLDQANYQKPVVKEIANKMADLFWYPKIPKNTLYNPKNPAHQAEWKTLTQKTYDQKDNPTTPRYRKMSSLRDNDLNKLCLAMERHIALCFECWPDMHLNQKRIVKSFLERVLVKENKKKGKKNKIDYGWHLVGNEKKLVFDTISTNLDNLYVFLEIRKADKSTSDPEEACNITQPTLKSDSPFWKKEIQKDLQNETTDPDYKAISPASSVSTNSFFSASPQCAVTPTRKTYTEKCKELGIIDAIPFPISP